MMKNSGQNLAVDTAADAERIQIDLIRRLPVWKKCAQIVELNRTLRVLALADIRHRHPHADDREMRRLYALRLLPSELVERVYEHERRS